jgi:hypothetical protein
MQIIETEFEDRTFRYTQLARQGMIALYSQTHKPSGVTRYEVVVLRVAAAHTWPNGSVSPERETYPGATAWGRYGWTFFVLGDAQAHLAALAAQRLAEPEADEPEEPDAATSEPE